MRQAGESDEVVEARKVVCACCRSPYAVSRVCADPPVEGCGHPGGFGGVAYVRQHGLPKSASRPATTDIRSNWQALVAEAGGQRWVIFDNTASGAAAKNALDFMSCVSTGHATPRN